ncbi:MAG: hypothetical protein NZ553_17070 [Caldilinea sp.]|nr:hypothetical protein [Caldilinea sp.]MDW8442193.1 hypothetical protein [Caldilineaceae bacterium]
MRRRRLTRAERDAEVRAINARARLATMVRSAFLEPNVFENASLIVFTRSQMNGLRAWIKRLRIAESPGPGSWRR